MTAAGRSPFKVVFICTGNRCRSPFAARYFERLVANMPVEVFSVGTLDAPGMEVPQELIEIGRSSGLELDLHRSQTLTKERVDVVDLAIGFERQHVAEAVVNAGVPPDKAFTLREMARLLQGIDSPAARDRAARAREVVAAAAAKRAEGPAFVPNEEMDDPFQQPYEVYRASADEIVELCNALFRALFGSEPSFPR